MLNSLKLLWYYTYRVQLKKVTQRLKCDYSVTPLKFWRQILYDTCLAVFCSLMCCFCLKLLYVHEIGITPNFKFKIFSHYQEITF